MARFQSPSYQVSGTGELITRDTGFLLDVAQGRVPGYSVIDKFGVNPEITTASDPEDVWEAGGEYQFSTTDDIVSLSSSDNGDNQDIEIQGLDVDGNEVIQTITLSGQTRVALDTALWRVYRMQNEGTTDLAGTVYCYSGTTNTAGVPSGGSVIKAIISNGNNQTLMAIYTIPKGKVGFLYRGEIGIDWEGGAFSGSEFARMFYKSRRFGKVFKVKKSVSLITSGDSNYQDYRVRPDPVPALTDIKITVDEVSATMGAWATLDIMLVGEEKLSPEFLTAIGQPS